MKNQNTHHTCKTTSVFVALALTCFGLASAAQAGTHPSIVGLWSVHYVSTEGGPPSDATDQWYSDGLEFEVAGFAPGAVCQGTYKQTGDGKIHLHHVGYTFDATGAPSGNFVEPQTNTVSADGTTYSGTYSENFYDVNGNLVFSDAGTVAATLITPRG
ncbi:MAG: hypothetical protein ABI217_10515 [Chthoniobacterales bacterium]